MNDATFAPTPLTDPLGEVLHTLHLTGTLYCRATMSAPWGLIMPTLVDSMMFIIVTSGQCFIRIENDQSLLQQGSMVLLPHGTSYQILSAPEVSPVPLFDVPVEKISARYELMTHGGGGAITRVTAGVVQFDHSAAKRLVSLLPSMLRVDAWDEDVGTWVQSTLALIAREASTLRPGGETVMTRLADILVIQAIRSWLDHAPDASLGWLSALRDPKLGRALALIHRQPAHTWTVAALARESGMSRSTFAAQFTARVGQSPMQYFAEWRLQTARDRLATTRDQVSIIASECGYASEAAFGRAFKKVFGMSPGALRKIA